MGARCLKLGHWESQVVIFGGLCREHSGGIQHLCEPPLIKTLSAPLTPTSDLLGHPTPGGPRSESSTTSLLFILRFAPHRGESWEVHGEGQGTQQVRSHWFSTRLPLLGSWYESELKLEADKK